MSGPKRTPTQKQLNDCAKEVGRLARKYTDKEVIDVIAPVTYPCNDCDGHGYFSNDEPFRSRTEACPTCKTAGVVPDRRKHDRREGERRRG